MWKKIDKYLLGFLLLICCSAAQEGLLVSINDGLVQGYISNQGTHKVFFYTSIQQRK